MDDHIPKKPTSFSYKDALKAREEKIIENPDASARKILKHLTEHLKDEGYPIEEISSTRFIVEDIEMVVSAIKGSIKISTVTHGLMFHLLEKCEKFSQKDMNDQIKKWLYKKLVG